MRKIKFIYWLLGMGCGVVFTGMIGTFLTLKMSESTSITSYSVQSESMETSIDQDRPLVNIDKDKQQEMLEQDEIAMYKNIDIPKGMGASDVCKLLKQMAIIEDDKAFLAYIKENKKEKKIKDGRFNLKTKMNYQQLLEALTL